MSFFKARHRRLNPRTFRGRLQRRKPKEISMAIQLTTPAAPPYLKIGFFGHTGTGKTWTACKLLSQFIAEFMPGKRLAFFDTEGGAGYVKKMVLDITGKELLSISSRSFSELIEFADLCKAEGHVALLDSATHPWRSLCTDYLTAKASRVKGVGGDPDSVRLSLKDWGPLKDIWNQFSYKFTYDPIHWCICGREGDVWTTEKDDEGNEEMRKTGEKMKTETELGYEPSLLVRMVLIDGKHIAQVVKERFGVLTGKECPEPDIEFFRPHLKLLGMGGTIAAPNPKAAPAVAARAGRNWEGMQRERKAIMEEIQADIVSAYPGQSAAEKKLKVDAVRFAYDTASWSALENDFDKWSNSALKAGRAKLQEFFTTHKATSKDKE
jgi:hypothetical protein